MNSNFHIKEELYSACEESIKKRIYSIEQNLTSIEESRDNETKSSVGDKYETGRSMLQIEEENSRSQLSQANRVWHELKKINPQKRSKVVELGSLVRTNNGDYYISIGIGKIRLESGLYYCISVNSPIGMKMISKKVGDEIEFNGMKIDIKEVS